MKRAYSYTVEYDFGEGTAKVSIHNSYLFESKELAYEKLGECVEDILLHTTGARLFKAKVNMEYVNE